jgi:hypothetical protein
MLPIVIIEPEELKRFALLSNPIAQPDEYVEAQKEVGGLTIVLTEWYRVSENFKVLFEEFNEFGSGETNDQEALTETIMKLQLGVGEANGRAVILSAKLGADPAALDHGLVTVWEAMQGMKSDIRSLGTAVKSRRKEVRESLMGSKGASEAVKTLTSEFVAMG